MPASRRTYVRWLGITAVALAAEVSIAAVAIAVVGRPPSAIVARSTAASPSPVPSITLPPGSTSSQSARPWSAAAFYPPSGKVVFFGGVSQVSPGFQASNETWTWDGANWLLLHPVNSPPPRFNPGLVYDAAHQVLVLQGGSGNQQGGFLNDTWTWDGTNWKQMSPKDSPPKWFNAPMTYDATRNGVLLYVGVGAWPTVHPDQTWLWDGTNWSLVPTATDPNSTEADHPSGTIVYDSATAQTLFVGATGTWVLEAGGWRRLTGGGTTGNDYAIVDDPASGVLVEVGTDGDTWTWDGKAWTAQNPTTAPSPRGGEAIAYDPMTRQVVIHGGFVGNPAAGQSLSDTWVWDGTTWKQVA